MKHLAGVAFGALALATLGQAQYRQINLVSDIPGLAAQTDPNLVNAWGLDFGPTSPLWVAANGTATSTVYQNDGTIIPLVVSIPGPDPAPTGIVFNGGTGFAVSNGSTSAAAKFIFVSEDGTISGWAPSVDATHAVPAVQHPHANYKGVTIGSVKGVEYLYAANFRSGYVEMYNTKWQQVAHFTDFNLPRAYSPFNVKAYGNFLIVTFAKGSPEFDDETHGAGLGFVDIFTTGGKLVTRLFGKGALNAPWGIALSINKQGALGSRLYVGNFGDGKINKYDLFTGQWLGPVRDTTGHPIVIDGLWALAFRNVTDSTSGAVTTNLFFTAGPNDESHGLLGTLVPASAGG